MVLAAARILSRVGQIFILTWSPSSTSTSPAIVQYCWSLVIPDIDGKWPSSHTTSAKALHTIGLTCLINVYYFLRVGIALKIVILSIKRRHSNQAHDIASPRLATVLPYFDFISQLPQSRSLTPVTLRCAKSGFVGIAKAFPSTYLYKNHSWSFKAQQSIPSTAPLQQILATDATSYYEKGKQ